MGVKAGQDPADLRALTFWVAGQFSQVGRIRQARPDVGVGKTSDTVLAGHHRFEELCIVAGKWIEGPDSTAGSALFTSSTI